MDPFFKKSKNRDIINRILSWIIISSAFLGVFIALCIFFSPAYFNTSLSINTDLASDFGGFFGGFIGTIFSILSSLMLIYTIYNQKIEREKEEVTNHFFKMIDYHNENVSQLKIPHLKTTNQEDKSEGRRSFVEFKLQIHHLLKIVEMVNQENNYNLNKDDILDIVYILFYYGIDESWISFIHEKLKKYNDLHNGLIEKVHQQIKSSDLELGRTNQTNLSTYFRNMYNALKLVDDALVLSEAEKQNLVRIYRAQLSNPELYVLFFNLASRFGKNWKSKNYITKYEFIKNIPSNYCDGYCPNEFFKMKYEDEEYD
ncbi:MAG: putative phage abortive infection protein [Fluviicola sp.]